MPVKRGVPGKCNHCAHASMPGRSLCGRHLEQAREQRRRARKDPVRAERIRAQQRADYASHRRERIAKASARKTAKRAAARAAAPPRFCTECGAVCLPPNQRLCGPDCRRKRNARFALDCYRRKARLRRRPAKACAECGSSFVPTFAGDRARFCKRQCLRKHADRVGGNHRKRARKFGVDYEVIDPLLVFERDGWRCQICGRRTSKRQRGTNHRNAPELDHRIPMARGGGHTYANVQCACRSCNVKKSAKECSGQLPFWHRPTGTARGGHG